MEPLRVTPSGMTVNGERAVANEACRSARSSNCACSGSSSMIWISGALISGQGTYGVFPTAQYLIAAP
jgi:hypothetical protein